MNNETDKFDYNHVDIEKFQKKQKYDYIKNMASIKDIKSFIDLPTNLLSALLKKCENGQGSLYEKLVLATFIKSFGEIIDKDLVRQRIPIDGGFADIELPFSLEMLTEYPHWTVWQRDYQIKSIIVEVKNLNKKASYEDANQLKGYIDGNHKGKCGFLVSKNGFTNEALKTLKSHAHNNYLLLPLKNSDLLELLEINCSQKVIRYLRRIEECLYRIR